MILDIAKRTRTIWREITKLVRPIDGKKPVIIGSNPKAQSDFEAYTNNEKIFINVNNEAKFQKDIEDIIIPAYRSAAKKLYDVTGTITDFDLMRNLVFDTFLFVHFHEQMHPWLCPNSKEDEKKISKVLYDGICEAEPNLGKADAMFKVNNCKNLIWDVVLNTSFISKVAGHNNDILEEKISYVFNREEREIAGQFITKYPCGILPIVYMTSAHNHSTDIPIALIGAFYTSLSYNDASLRKKAMGVFLNDLKTKKIDQKTTENILVDMYKGIVSKLDSKKALKRRINIGEYKRRISIVTDLSNSAYEDNQKYFVETITRIFDTPSLRYDALKGFVMAISKYVSLQKKQGSPDPNSSGGGGGGGSGDDESDSGSPGSGDSGGDEGEIDEDAGGSGGCGKTQEEIDDDSINSTLDDLLDKLDPKDADDLLEDAANAPGGGGAGKPSSKAIQKVRIRAIDEYYKKNAEVLELRNPREERESVDIGKRKKWVLMSSNTITAQQVALLNQKQIQNFQRMTGLPILMDIGNGFYKINHYESRETPLQSYTNVSTGIEIPDNWIFIQDSSSSMGYSDYVGTNCRLDLLNHVKYGLMKGVYTAAGILQKDPLFGVVDFSNSTRYQGVDSLVKIYDANSHPIKTISLTPQIGGTAINTKIFPRIEKVLNPGKTLWTMITDGQISGCESNPENCALYAQIDRLSSKPDNSFVFVEIDSDSKFGAAIEKLAKKKESVHYFPVSDVREIKDKLGTLVVGYS